MLQQGHAHTDGMYTKTQYCTKIDMPPCGKIIRDHHVVNTKSACATQKYALQQKQAFNFGNRRMLKEGGLGWV